MTHLPTVAIAAFVAMFHLAGSAAFGADIDFTKLGEFKGPLAKGSIGGRVPDGSDHAKPNPPAQLPLSVRIRNVSPSIVGPGSSMRVEIEIRNLGDEPILIPVTKDDEAVLRPGNQGQRFLAVRLRFAHPDAKQETLATVGLAVGSSSVPGSMVSMEPHQILLLEGVASLSDTLPWHERDKLKPGVLKTTATVTIEDLEDDRLWMKRRSVATSPADTTIIWSSPRPY